MEYMLFVCVFQPTSEFSFIWIRHYYQGRAATFDLCLARMATEQCGFLFQRVTTTMFVICYFRVAVTLTSVAERLAVELSLTAFQDFSLSRLKFKHQASRMWNRCSYDETHMKKEYTVRCFEKTLVVIITYISAVSIMITYYYLVTSVLCRNILDLLLSIYVDNHT